MMFFNKIKKIESLFDRNNKIRGQIVEFCPENKRFAPKESWSIIHR